MSLATFFRKLQEHEMELIKLNQHEENDKKKKEIALKASSSIQEESDKEDLNEIKEDDDFSFFIKRFNKFLRNKGNQRIIKQSCFQDYFNKHSKVKHFFKINTRLLQQTSIASRLIQDQAFASKQSVSKRSRLR